MDAARRDGGYAVTGNGVVLAVALLVWVLLWVYLSRLERRVKSLEKQ